VALRFFYYLIKKIKPSFHSRTHFVLDVRSSGALTEEFDPAEGRMFFIIYVEKVTGVYRIKV